MQRTLLLLFVVTLVLVEGNEATSEHAMHKKRKANRESNEFKVDKPGIVADKTEYTWKLKPSHKRTEHIIENKNDKFVQIHFARFDLPVGDILRIKSSGQTLTYSNKGPDGGYTSQVQGKLIKIYYEPSVTPVKEGNKKHKGIVIDYLIQGLTKKRSKREDVCGIKPAWAPAVCFNGAKELPLGYKVSQAVSRMIIGGVGAGTGFLIGCDGLFLTNNHNVDDQEKTTNTRYELGAECNECDNKLNNESLACEGTYIINGATLLATDKTLDYSLLQFEQKDHAMLEKFGYLKIRESGPELGEEIYVPQHPEAKPRQIVMSYENGTRTTISSLKVENECGKNQVGYFADTMGGSSGSPIMAVIDNKVVALHHCGGCENVAYSMDKILADLKDKKIHMPKCLFGDVDTSDAGKVIQRYTGNGGTGGAGGGDAGGAGGAGGTGGAGSTDVAADHSGGKRHKKSGTGDDAGTTNKTGGKHHVKADATGGTGDAGAGGDAGKTDKTGGKHHSKADATGGAGGATDPSDQPGGKHHKTADPTAGSAGAGAATGQAQATEAPGGGGGGKSGNGGGGHPVSVCKDAVYAVNGHVCSGSGAAPQGQACPMQGDKAISHCLSHLPSYNGQECIAKENAACALINGHTWGCVFPSSGC